METQTTFLIGSHNRYKKALEVIKSVKKLYPDIKIIVGDDGEKDYSQEIEATGAKYMKIPYDSGLSYTRNRMIEASDTEFVFVTDESKMVTKLDLEKMRSKLDNGFDVIAGVFSYTQTATKFIPQKDGKYVLYEWPLEKPEDESQCIQVDRPHNFYLARKSTLLEVPYRENLKMGEHAMHSLDLMKNGKRGLQCFDIVTERVNLPDPKGYEAKKHSKGRKAYNDFCKDYFRWERVDHAPEGVQVLRDNGYPLVLKAEKMQGTGEGNKNKLVSIIVIVLSLLLMIALFLI